MNKTMFNIIFYMIILVIAIASWTNITGLIIALIITGLLAILFAGSISKNVRVWFRGWRLFIKPHIERNNTPWDFYTPEEYLGEKGGKIFIRICGSIILIAGILVLILN